MAKRNDQKGNGIYTGRKLRQPLREHPDFGAFSRSDGVRGPLLNLDPVPTLNAMARSALVFTMDVPIPLQIVDGRYARTPTARAAETVLAGFVAA